MGSIQITGGRRLCGTLSVSGAKNAALPILAAAAAIGDTCVIENCPNIRDVDTALKIIRCLGCKAEQQGSTVTVCSQCRTSAAVPEDLSLQMRSSVLFLGALCGAGEKTVIHTPGGCVLGKRPIDLHISGLQNLGAEVTIEGSRIYCTPIGKSGGTVFLPYPSVGATENLMLASIRSEAPVWIIGAAREPEITDLAGFLTGCGASVTGAGTSAIRICGGKLHGTRYRVMPDRMETVTYLAAAAATGGSLTLKDTDPQSIAPVLQFFHAAGCKISETDDSIFLAAGELHGTPPVLTGPYPAFPTDAQPTVMAAVLKAEGTTVFAETVFENRFRHVPALCALGADIRVCGRIAAVRGVKTLTGTEMTATDLRGGAAMLVAALSAEGTSTVLQTCHIRRGYENLVQKLRSIGACLTEQNEDETI